MEPKLDKDGNVIDPKEPGSEGDQGNKDGDKGAGGDKTKGNGGAEGALTKEDIQTIVKDTIAEAVKGEVTSLIDSRISGATKTIYKKVGVKEDPDNQNQSKTDGAKADQDRLDNRKEMVNVYAETAVKEELGKLEPEIQAIVDKLLPLEISGIEFEEGISNKDHAQVVANTIVTTVKAMKDKIESAKVEALKKAGQVIDVGTGGGKSKPEDEYASGKKLAEQRHKKKKK